VSVDLNRNKEERNLQTDRRMKRQSIANSSVYAWLRVWREEKERRIEQTDIRVDERKTFTENIFSLQTRTKQQKERMKVVVSCMRNPLKSS
jgi:hypothetical protein